MGPDTAPPTRDNTRRLLTDVIHQDVRKGIGQLRCAFHGIGIEAVLERRRQPARKDRGRGDTMAPGNRHALSVEAGGEPVVVVGPVDVVLDVFFAGPNHLDRTIDLLGDLHRLGDEIHLEPPAEAAAEQVVMSPGPSRGEGR